MGSKRKSKPCIETERVIAAVSAWPALWDPADERHRKKPQRARAWAAVCAQALDHFHRYSDEDQRELEKRVQQRWRTARDCFVKAAGARGGGGGGGGGGGAGGDYMFLQQLAFLEPTLRRPRPLPSERAQPASHTQEKLDDKPRVSRVSSPPRSPRRGALERALLAAARRADSPLAPDDESFFRSLAPALAALAPHQKLLFRSRVLAVALDLQVQSDPVFVEAPLLSQAAAPAADASDGDEPPERKFRPSASPATAALSSSDDSS